MELDVSNADLQRVEDSGLKHSAWIVGHAGARSPTWTAEDERWMREAISLARDMQGQVWPNPPAGCVIVRDEEIVGRGQTQIGGRPHAERVALSDAGELARGATLYVTLEPCCHWGKTPPCADAIIAAGVSTVHASLQDLDPRVNGRGFRRLCEAGIRVTVGLGATEARGIVEGFFTRVALGRPHVTIATWPTDFLSWQDIPAPYDAVLTTSFEGKLSLATRSGAEMPETIPLLIDPAPDEIAQHLGSCGLTRVLLPADDALATCWRNAGLVDCDLAQASSPLPLTTSRPATTDLFRGKARPGAI